MLSLKFLEFFKGVAEHAFAFCFSDKDTVIVGFNMKNVACVNIEVLSYIL